MYGAAYYDEYMPYDRLEKDIEMMKAAGINVVRIAESTWSTLEPKEGEYNFTHIDRILDAMEKADIAVIIGTPTYAIPSWLAKKDDSMLTVTKNGQSRYGHRQNMDITNETFLYHAERIIRVLMEHVAKRNCVIGFQLDNETKHYGTAGERVQKRFLEYLKEKFGTVEELNTKFGLAYWSNALGTWDDMPDVLGTINASLACEFEKFQRLLVTNYLMWQSDLVKEYKREDQFITHNFDFEWKKFGADIAQDGYSYGVQPDVNHFQAAKSVTLAGTDIYHMTQDDLTGAEIAFGGDVIRSLKQANYLVLETEAQAFKNWVPYPGQLRLQAYSHIASGAIGVMYWHWHSIHNSFETYWKGLLSHDMDTNPTYEEAKIIGNEWKALSPKIRNLKKANKVAILVSNESLTSLKWFPTDKDLSYNDVVRWMYDTLYKMNVECDILFPESENIEQYSMIVVPSLYVAPEKLLHRLNDYVAQGGTLLASFRTGVSNEHVTVYHDKQPHILSECLGVTYNQFTEPKNVTLKDVELVLKVEPEQKTINYWMELLCPQGATVLSKYNHPYWGEYAAITKNQYKKGTAYYIGAYTSCQVLKEVFQDALGAAGLQVFDQEHNWPLTIRKGINEEGNELTFYFNYTKEAREFLCPYEKAQDVITQAIYELNEVIKMKDWGIVILEEMRKKHDSSTESNITGI